MAHPDLQTQCDLIMDTSRRLLSARPELWLAPLALLTDDQPLTIQPPIPPTKLMKQVFDERRLIQSDELVLLQPAKRKRTHPSVQPAAAAVPISSQGNLWGILQVERSDGTQFTDLDLNILSGLATQSAVALQAVRQTWVEQWRLEQLALVGKVSAQIANVLNLDELARRVTRLILETFNYYYVAIFTLEAGQDLLRFRDSAGPLRPGSSSTEETSPALTAHLCQGIIGHVAESGIEILANDVTQDPHYEPTDALPETRAEVAIPLKIGDRILGVLDVQSDQLNAFDATDLLVLRTLADNIAIAIEDARLYSDLRRRADQLASVAEVSNDITSILNLDNLLEEFVRLIQKRLGYPYLQLFTVLSARQRIAYRAGTSPQHNTLHNDEFYYKLDDPEGLIPWVTRHGETVVSNDVSAEPRYRTSGLFPITTQSELVIPLIFGGEVLGILDVQSDQPNAFGEEDRFLFEALADNLAIAIRNANLYQSEQWRRQVSEGMRAVAGLLSADADLPQVLNAILTQLEETLPCDVAAIWLLEDGTQTTPQLQLAAIHCQPCNQIPADVQLEPSPWLKEALQAEQPIVRQAETLDGLAKSDSLGIALNFPNDYSAIAAPLRIADQPLGVLVLAHHTPARYGHELQMMTATFASYAAVAIENTRLYEASHEQAWISTVLLQVAEATQSLTDINELLATVVRITPMLVGVHSCALVLWDEQIEAFLPAFAHGLSEHQQGEFEGWHFSPGDILAFDQVRIVKEPVAMYITIANEETAGRMYSSLVDDSLLRSKSLVLFPLLARGEVMGALLVDYIRGDFQKKDSIQKDGLMQEEKLAIIQGIVHQTAIAVENNRLLKSQKEEAYVSIALLQVAQAVVSLNELSDILETIVRITPILVGVKRAAIYLWDEERYGFQLSQSYGIPRQLEDELRAQFYPAEHFPLLDVVFETDSLVYYPLSDPPEEPEEWSSLQPFELEEIENDETLETTTSYTDGETSHEFLRLKHSLLLGFQLSVKGKVLGVLLTEETDPSLGIPSFHVRERRLEIMTGISQQAALAIQNEQLQREVVARERLEREFQLAREIQQTFLPHVLPLVPGWDLDVRWRPAREVAGDFYDLFELPDGNLGVIIADVADKGMPAALFMTLIRTLVRAAVQEEDSPAAVLERVNDLLVPDTQNGMFVTVLYAVLTPEMGRLTYANAGHNPALLRRADNHVEIFATGGIALGILEHITLAEHTVTLEPGDCIVFYTDGVTEAFSANEEMYTAQRLVNLVQNTPLTTANELLNTIDNSVAEFSGDLTPSDDITLVALVRT